MKLVSLGSFLVALSFFVYSFGGTWVAIPILSFIFITFGEIIIFPFTNSWAMEQSTEKNRGSYMAYYGMAFSAAHIIAPPLGMNMAESFGFNIMWMTITAIAVISSLSFYLIHKY